MLRPFEITRNRALRNRLAAPHPAPTAVPAGLSLLELLVVLVILMATALIVVPSLSISIDTPTKKAVTPNEIVTQATMNVLRDAMVGKDGMIENLAHRPEVLPTRMSDLLAAEPPQQIERNAPDLATYDPLIGIGWRGPYLIPTGRNREGAPAMIDGWGNELQLQIDFDNNGQVDADELHYVRVVSPGPNGKIETPLARSKMKPGSQPEQELTIEDCGDDLVMFLRVPDYRQ